jgi:hypothetical protein
MAKKREPFKRTIKGETKEFAKLAAKEALGFGTAALHVAGVLLGFTNPRNPKGKKK